ncbi:hypothetical protein TNCV_3826491 [Trichonephila clavipes]|nr:hypothetical protein TNCV_3826491 [Trichonephila clavipes]
MKIQELVISSSKCEEVLVVCDESECCFEVPQWLGSFDLITNSSVQEEPENQSRGYKSQLYTGGSNMSQSPETVEL